MRRLRVEVVAGTVQIHRQEENRVETILLAVCLRLHQHHFLCQTVGRVGLFGIANPQIVFLERNRREFGISANRANGYEFANAIFVRLVHELHAHHQVVVKEISGMFHVRADATHVRGKVNDDHVLSINTLEAIRV